LTGELGKGLDLHFLKIEGEAHDSVLNALRAELKGKGVPEGSGGYELLVVDDPDGELARLQRPQPD
jgi:hypothetical protein